MNTSKSRAAFWAWKPSDKFDTPYDPARCAHTVYEKWCIDVRGHQCIRKKRRDIDGYGFCLQHARMIDSAEGRPRRPLTAEAT